MNTHTLRVSPPTIAPDQHPRFQKFIFNSAAATLGMTLAVMAFLSAVPCANAAASVTTADQDFILAAVQGGLTEVKLGELAARNGKRDDVKQFGQMMVKDHTAINADLEALASQKGVTLPGRLDAKHQGMVDKMTGLAGSEFDDAYITGMIKDHQTDAREFKAVAAETKDPDIKSFLDKSIPVVERHLKHITAMKP